MHKKRKISEIPVRIRHCVLRSDLSISLFPFSRALFARVFLFSLAPVYFFLLSSPRTYVIASRFTVMRFQVPHLTRNHPQLSNPIYSLFNRPAWLSFFLSLFLCLLLHRIDVLRCIRHLSLSCSPLVRSILLHFSRDRSSPFFSPPRHYTRLLLPFPLSVSDSSFSSSLILGHPPFSTPSFLPHRSSNFLPSSATSSRRSGDIAKKSSYRVMPRDWIFPN